jgi:hypothetical protein
MVKKMKQCVSSFLDFKKAYDSVRREFLYNIFIQYSVPVELVRLIKNVSGRNL